MKENILRLFKGTFIYSSGHVLSRMITFFLLPITTSYLTPEDYGVIGTLAILGLLFNGLFTLGFGVSLSRCYWSTEDVAERHGIIWTGFAILLLDAVLITGIAAIFSSKISFIALGTEKYPDLIILTFLTASFSSVILPFASYFRMEEKAVLVVCLSIFEVLISISLTIYFVVFLGRAARGAIEAGLIAQGVNFILMLVICLSQLNLTFRWGYLPDMLKIGYPYIFGLFGNYLLQSTSRYMLQFFTDMETVGLFFMGSNFAQVVALAVGGFISAWPPFFTSFLNKQDEAIKIFGRVLTYYIFGISALVILFFALARPIVFLMVQPSYYSVWTVVGIMAVAQASWGVYGISAAALIFYKKSSWQVLMEAGAGILCIGLNALLIPFFHKEGAAIATLLSYIALVSVSFMINHRLLPVEYEKKRVFQAICALAVAAMITFLPITNPVIYNSLMVFTVLGFYFYLWSYCLTTSERQTLLSFFTMKKAWQPMA